jgi:hypothetical protein
VWRPVVLFFADFFVTRQNLAEPFSCEFLNVMIDRATKCPEIQRRVFGTNGGIEVDVLQLITIPSFSKRTRENMAVFEFWQRL